MTRLFSGAERQARGSAEIGKEGAVDGDNGPHRLGRFPQRGLRGLAPGAAGASISLKPFGSGRGGKSLSDRSNEEREFGDALGRLAADPETSPRSA